MYITEKTKLKTKLNKTKAEKLNQIKKIKTKSNQPKNIIKPSGMFTVVIKNDKK